jgi:hypothetical protein
MNALNRRQLLSGTAATVIARGSCFSSVLATSIVTRPASAEPVTVAIAVAAAIAGMIAAHNRRSPLGSYFQYLSGKIDIVIAQLTTIQSGLALVISKLAELDEILTKGLAENAIKELHEIGGVLVGYDKLREILANYPQDEAFRNAGRSIMAVDERIARIQHAVEMLISKGAFGPATALIMPSCFFVEYSLLTLRNEPSRNLLGAMRANRRWIDRFLDAGDPKSTASYVAKATTAEANAYKAALESPLGARLGMKPGSAALLCVGYNHHKPATTTTSKQGKGPDGDIYDTHHSPEVRGPNHRRMRSYSLAQRRKMQAFEENGPAYDAGYEELILALSEPSEVMSDGDPRIPPNCDVKTGDFVHRTPGERWLTDRMLDRPEVTTVYPEFGKLIQEINLQRAKISYGTAARAVLEDASAQLDAIIAELDEAGR